MASASADAAIRNYLTALRDPKAMRDDNKISKLRSQLESASDELERLRLRQQIIDAETPSLDAFEEAFVAHAKDWATNVGVTERAFLEEGVPPQTLRRAGFRVPGGRGRSNGRSGRSRTRVRSEDVRAAIPRGNFTIKDLQDSTGASSAVVRKIVLEEEKAGRVKKVGTAKTDGGPGRAPSLYKRA